MLLDFKTDASSLEACLPMFLELVGAERWKKRVAQLASDASRSPAHAKIADDYHWLELALSEYLVVREAGDGAVREPFTVELLAGLYFAQTVVGVVRHLGASGQRVLNGRLRDALKADVGFAPLYLEMSVARRLFDARYDVEFSDMEGLAQFDLRFWKDDAHGEVECKSLSCDAGRKVHRKDFYRFIDAVGGLLRERAASGGSEVLLVTLDDRLPAHVAGQRELSEAATRLLSESRLQSVDGAFFTMRREPYDARLKKASGTSEREFYAVCRALYGDSCHVSGVMTPDEASVVVVRSSKEDDHSAPLLEAMRKAATQLSRSRPGFIAVQFDDIGPADLLLAHLRRRIGILSYALFGRAEGSHVAATAFSAYRGLVVSEEGTGDPGVGIPNSRCSHQVSTEAYPPFLGHVPDDEFARLLGEPRPTENISHIAIDPAKREGA